MELKFDKDNYKSWSYDTKHALWLYRILAKCLGFWPMNCELISAKIRIITVVFIQVNYFNIPIT